MSYPHAYLEEDPLPSTTKIEKSIGTFQLHKSIAHACLLKDTFRYLP